MIYGRLLLSKAFRLPVIYKRAPRIIGISNAPLHPRKKERKKKKKRTYSIANRSFFSKLS